MVDAFLHCTKKDLRMSMCMSGYGAMTFVLRKKKNIDDGAITNWNGVQNTRKFGTRIIYNPEQAQSYGVGQDDDGSNFEMVIKIKRKEMRMLWSGFL